MTPRDMEIQSIYEAGAAAYRAGLSIDTNPYDLNNKTHIHHRIPKHAGGTDDPSNLVELSIDEHAMLHKFLWEQYGREEDYKAYKGLLGMWRKANQFDASVWNAGYEGTDLWNYYGD